MYSAAYRSTRDHLDRVRFSTFFGSAVHKITIANAALLSIPTDGRYPALELTPRRQKDLTIEALTRQVLALARTKPVLFVIEDAHWIDPSSLRGLGRSQPACGMLLLKARG